MMGNSADWLQAQAAVLGSVLLDDRWAGEVVLQTGPEDYSGAYRTVFQAVRDLFQAGSAIDPVIVRNRLGPDYGDFLRQLMEVTPTAVNCGEYIALTKEQARLIRLQELAEQLKAAHTLEEAGHLVDRANALLCQRSNLQVLSLAGSIPAFLERHRQEKTYLAWGFPELDENLYCEGGDFVLLGGYPSAGKTALALQFAWNQSAEKRVGFFSLETTEFKLQDRAMSMITRVAFDHIKRSRLTEQDVGAIGLKARQIEGHSLDFVRGTNLTVTDIQAAALSKRYEIIYIDYVQLIQPLERRGNRTEQVGQISRDLHTMAQSTGITVVGLSQLSRAEETGGKVRAPTMSSLRESGQLEQDADAILLLYKEEPDRLQSRRVCKAVKNKEGKTFGFMLAFDGATQSFKPSYAGPFLPKTKQEPELHQVSFQELEGETPFDVSGA